MTTARAMIADELDGNAFLADRILLALQKAPESVRLELAALLNPELIKALREMCDLAQENSQYKGEYLAEKHGDAIEIAKARRFLPAPPSEDKA